MAFYFGIIKEPRGLIRVLQLIFSIFAFATACSGGSYLRLTDSTNKVVVNASWSYPYDLRDAKINTQCSQNQSALSNSNSVKPSAEFFVFTGVTSMLLSLIFLIVYIVLDRLYRYNPRIPVVDWVITLIWTIFWIAGSCAWAQGVTNIRQQTSSDFVKSVVYCNSDLKEDESGTYSNVIVSVIFGFLNFVLWLGSVWFVFKETKFFKNRTAQQYPQQNNFANITDPYLQQQTRVPGT